MPLLFAAFVFLFNLASYEVVTKAVARFADSITDYKSVIIISAAQSDC